MKFGIIVLAATSVAVAFAQTSDPSSKPRFDAASIRPCRPTDGAGGGRDGKSGGGGRNFSRAPGRLTINCMTVADMIDVYAQFGEEPLINDPGLPGDARRIRGGPSWMNSERYTIAAVSSNPVATGPTGRGTPADKMLAGTLLLALLEDRFQLKMRREVEEVPAFSLTVAKPGKLKPTEPGSCTPLPAVGNLPEPGPGEKPLCENHGGWKGPNWTLDATDQPLEKVANMLGLLMLGRPVMDKTGLTGKYTLHLVFAHDESAPGDFPPDFPNVFPSTDEPMGPSVFSALDQYGLKLAPDKAPRGYLLVESVARPSEN